MKGKTVCYVVFLVETLAASILPGKLRSVCDSLSERMREQATITINN